MAEEQLEVTEKTLTEVARLGGLPLRSERMQALLPQLRSLRQELGKLGELDLRETEPANIFVVRGRE